MLKCFHCRQESDHGILVPTATWDGPYVMSIRQSFLCSACASCSDPISIVGSSASSHRAMNALPYGVYADPDNPPKVHCFMCKSVADVSQASNVIDGSPSWFVSGNRLSRTSFLQSLMFRELKSLLHSPHHIRMYSSYRFHTVGRLSVFCFSGVRGYVETRIPMRSMPMSRLEHDMFLCDSCHTELERIKCPNCNLFSNNIGSDGICDTCRLFSGDTIPESVIPDLVCRDCGKLSSVDIPAFASDRRINLSRLNLMRYMVATRMGSCNPCSCPEVLKRKGWCSVCGDDRATYEDGVQGICERCCKSRRNKPMQVELKEPTFGSELELITSSGDRWGQDGFIRRTYRDSFDLPNNDSTSFEELSIGSDCSLSCGGVEIRVGPLNKKHLDKFKVFVSKLSERFHADSSCGGHVHFGAQPLRWFTIRDLARYAYNWQEQFLTMVPPRRRRNSYCSKIPQEFARFNNAKTEADYVSNLIRPYHDGARTMSKDKEAILLQIAGGSFASPIWQRYLWFNISSIFYKRTIEIRLLEGTTDARRLGAWIEAWLYLITKLGSESEDERELLLKQSPIELFQRFGFERNGWGE